LDRGPRQFEVQIFGIGTLTDSGTLTGSTGKFADYFDGQWMDTRFLFGFHPARSASPHSINVARMKVRRIVCSARAHLVSLFTSQTLVGLAMAMVLVCWTPANAQQSETDDANADVGSVVGDPSEAKAVTVAQNVQIDPLNSDTEIAGRLEEIFSATGWFDQIGVTVERGVVFLVGEADTEPHREWAEKTAMNTSDVVAVVNRLKLAEKPFWNLAPAVDSIRQLARETTTLLPLLVVAIVIAILFYYLAAAAAALTRRTTQRRVASTLLREVSGNVVGVLIFIIGLYVALRVSGLTRLAVTLLGGTGLVGLALGFAFRDIAENYLASILISLHHPFRVGDLIEVDGSKGFVRKVTTRGTVLNTLEGNEVQIPNSIVYKNKVQNFTATPLLRLEFGVGIGFDDSITEAQRLAMEVFLSHPAVVADPAPLVLVQSLGAATVNLKCLYWIDQTKHSPLKVGSALIRLVKQQLTSGGVSMPDEAREIIFPQGVHVVLDRTAREQKDQPRKADPSNRIVQQTPKSPEAAESKPASDALAETASIGEGDLDNEQADVLRVTEGETPVSHEKNLLD
jgi:small-conductance mechanosensitive channel